MTQTLHPLPTDWQQQNELLLLLFMRDGSGTSQMMRGHVEEVLAEHGGAVVAYSVDGDRYPALFEEFRISRVPTLYVVHCGQLLRRFEGLFPLAELKTFVSESLPDVMSCY